MPRHNAYRSRGAVETVGSELSSGQLGIGIAVALIFGLVCFILGYVVANVDSPLPGEIVAVSGDNGGKPSGAEAGASANPQSAKASSPPATTDTPPARNPTAPGTSVTPSSPSRNPTEPSQRTGIARTGIEALPTPGGPTPMVKTPINIGTGGGVSAPRPDAGATSPAEAPPIVPPANTTPSTEPAPGTSPAPVADPAPVAVANNDAGATAAPKPAAPEVKPPVSSPPATKPPSSPPPTVTRGSYGVQVAAFNGPRRSEQATEARKRLKEATGLDAEILKTSDGDYEKVIITGFSTPEAAKAQCEKLKEKAGYASSWVVPVR